MGTMPRFLFIVTVVLFGAIGLAYMNQEKEEQPTVVLTSTDPLSVSLDLEEVQPSSPASEEEVSEPKLPPELELEPVARVDRLETLFRLSDPKSPLVKTVTYKSRVSWLQGRPAWVADYAKHYKTSRHFIARGLNGGADYFSQNISNGDRFNVIDDEKEVRFELIVDVARCQALFYGIEGVKGKRELLKTYDVGLGRMDPYKASGCLTPLGTYELGERIAIYKPKSTGWFNGEKVDMIRIFGTRWIPFEKEIANCTAQAKGFGVHGAPYSEDPSTGRLKEDLSCIGKYESDGCIRFSKGDIEEIFSIVITRPTTVQIVNRFEEVETPGVSL